MDEAFSFRLATFKANFKVHEYGTKMDVFYQCVQSDQIHGTLPDTVHQHRQTKVVSLLFFSTAYCIHLLYFSEIKANSTNILFVLLRCVVKTLLKRLFVLCSMSIFVVEKCSGTYLDLKRQNLRI